MVLSGSISAVRVDTAAQQVVVQLTGQAEPVAVSYAAGPVTIQDEAGNRYRVNSDGNLSKGGSTSTDGSTSGSIAEDTSYPFKQFLILGYNGQIGKDEWYYCTTKALSTTHKDLFEENIIRLRKGYSGVVYGQLQFDTDCEVDYSRDMTIKAEYLYHGSADAKFYIAKWDEKYDIKWLLNGSEIADPNSMEDQLTIGSNTLELHVKPKEGGNFQSYASL